MIPQYVSFFLLPTGRQFLKKLLPDKVYADVINGLQYRVAKIKKKKKEMQRRLVINKTAP